MQKKVITVTKTTLHDADDHGYVPGTMAERISLVWELTQTTWGFMPNSNAESRLQRHVAVLARREG